MSFSRDLVKVIFENMTTTISDPVVDRWVFGDGEPSPLPQQVALDTISRIVDNQSEYDFVGTLLDERSRSLLADLIAFRALGPCRYALPMSTSSYMEIYARAAAYRTGPRSEVFPPFQFENFKLDHLGHSLEIGAWLGNIAATFVVRQYYLDAPRRIQPEPGDIVIDAGGCFGDTALAFAASVGERGKVYSFDPLPAHQAVMRSNFKRNRTLGDRIDLVPHALSHASGEVVRIACQGAASRMSDAGTIEVRTDTIDHLADRKGLKRVDFIKMDIEGAERSALVGARQTIAKYKPKLAISGYHSEDDLIIIPMLIKRLNPDYEIHFGHYTNYEGETVVYAV